MKERPALTPTITAKSRTEWLFIKVDGTSDLGACHRGIAELKDLLEQFKSV
jgi:hypothetical protein